jgi:hypothetical protein
MTDGRLGIARSMPLADQTPVEVALTTIVLNGASPPAGWKRPAAWGPDADPAAITNGSLAARPIVVLDLHRSPLVPSYIHLGGSPFDLDVHWSEPVPSDLIPDHLFQMHEPELCGISLLSNYSSHWPAVVAPDVPCLYLPRDVHEMVKGWARATCTPLTDGSRYDEQCYLGGSPGGAGGGLEAAEVPPLSFRLTATGPRLSVSLRGVCIRRHRYSTADLDMSITPQYIVLGTEILTQLLVALDFAERRVGLAMREPRAADAPLAAPGTHGCAAAAQCEGAQGYYAPSNRCVDPPCSASYFHTVDPEYHTCHLSLSYNYVFAAFLVIFAFGEVAVLEVYRKLTARVVALFPDVSGRL